MLATLLQDNLDMLLCSTDCEWYCKFCEKQWNDILPYDKQQVSDIANLVKGSLITFFPMSDSM